MLINFLGSHTVEICLQLERTNGDTTVSEYKSSYKSAINIFRGEKRIESSKASYKIYR